MAYGNRCLITGSSGMLGESVEKVFAKEFTPILTDIEDFDVRKYRKFIKDIPSPNYIVHLAAETNLEFCENYPRHAYWTNTIGTFNMVEIARDLDIPIVYMSTAGVFGKTSREFFDETDVPDPVNTYGRSKWYGELPVRSYPKHYIFRISWAFGGGARDRKFVMMMYKQLLQQPDKVFSVEDMSGSPSYTKDVAEVIRQCLADKWRYGTYHIPCGEASRWEVVEEMKKIMKLLWVKNEGVPASYFGNYTSTRPKCEVLRSIHPEVKVRPWQEALREYIDEITAGKYQS